MKGIISSNEMVETRARTNEIMIAGASVADLLKQHEDRLEDLDGIIDALVRGLRNLQCNNFDSRVTALEKRLKDLQCRVDEQVFDRITELEETVLEGSPCSDRRDENLESRVAALERTLKETDKNE